MQHPAEIPWVRQALESNRGRTNVTRNGFGSLCRILKEILALVPYKTVRRHNLDGDYERCSCFCQCFLPLRNNRKFLPNFVTWSPYK